MIQDFADRFIAQKDAAKAYIQQNAPRNYRDIVALAVRFMCDADDYGQPSLDRIHEIDDGHYQGTLVYVIGANGYQPYDYWTAKVSYGSCGGCDTLCAIQDSGSWGDDEPTDDQVNGYWTLALHIVQSLKAI